MHGAAQRVAHNEARYITIYFPPVLSVFLLFTGATRRTQSTLLLSPDSDIDLDHSFKFNNEITTRSLNETTNAHCPVPILTRQATRRAHLLDGAVQS